MSEHLPLKNLADLAMGETIIAADCDGNGYPIFSADTSDAPWNWSSKINRINKSGTIVVGARGSIGFPRLPRFEAFGATQTTITISPDKARILPEFLFYSLSRYDFKAVSAQQAVPMLTIAELGTVTVRCLPLPEQHAVARVLSALDTAIHQTEAIIAKLKAAKQGLLHNLLTRGIDANGELRPPQSEAPHIYKESRLGWVPKEWDLSTVGEQFEIQLGKMLDSQKNTGTLKPYVGNKAVQWDWVDLAEVQHVRLSKSDLIRFRLRKGDLLVCEGGDVGRAAIWEDDLDECYYQKALHRLRPLRDYHPRLMLEMLRYLMSRDALSEYVSRTSIAHLTQEKLANVPLPTPKVDEQERMVAQIVTAKQRLETEESQLRKFRLLKHGLMDDLLTGRVRVTPLLDETAQQEDT